MGNFVRGSFIHKAIQLVQRPMLAFAAMAMITCSCNQLTGYTLIPGLSSSAFFSPAPVPGLPGNSVLGTSPDPTHSFYVSVDGDDSNDGRTIASAWKTLAKVNSVNFAPGDFVLFKRGGVWRESLRPQTSGSLNHPISFQDYGDSSAAKPKFLGSIILTNSQFQSLGNGIFTYSVPTEVFSVLANQTFLLFPQGQPAQSLAGSWSYSGNTLTINSPNSDPRFDGKAYEAVVREDVISNNAQKHLVFQNLVADETAHYGGGYAFRMEQGEDILINNCEAYRAGKHHFGVINTTGFIGKNLYSAYAMPGQHWQPGDSASAYVSYGDSTGPSNQTSEWDNTVWEHPEDIQSSGNNYYAFFTHGANIGLVSINNMVSHQGNLSLSNGDNTNATVRLNGGWLDNARLEVDGSGIVVNGIHVSGPLGSIDLIGSQLTLQNSLIEGTSMASAWYQTAIAIRASGNVIRFNTIAVAADSSNVCVTFVNKDISAHLYGNIYVSNGRVLQLFDSAGTFNTNTVAESHHNLYLANATFGYISLSPNYHFVDIPLADWKTLGFDANSMTGDPRFVNRAGGNFALNSNSPAINAIPVGAINTPPLTDYLGNPRPRGSALDIGAYEF